MKFHPISPIEENNLQFLTCTLEDFDSYLYRHPAILDNREPYPHLEYLRLERRENLAMKESQKRSEKEKSLFERI
jgi:hypothetical protein